MPESLSASNTQGANTGLMAVYAGAIDRLRGEIGVEGEAGAVLLRDGWDSVDIETLGGLVFRFAKHENASVNQAMEARLLPFLRGHLTPAVPLPERYACGEEGLPHGVAVHMGPAGMPLKAEAITSRNMDRLARQIAGFLVELHQFPVDRAQALDVPGPRQWRGGYQTIRAEVLPALRPKLLISEYGKVRRWWSDFLADEQAWSFLPVLVHRGLVDETILVDAEARTISGVVGWGAAVVGDAAADFVGLVDSYGSDFTWRVTEAYLQHGSSIDGKFLRRVRRLSAATPFATIRRALAYADKGDGPSRDEIIDDGITRLRAGPILS